MAGAFVVTDGYIYNRPALAGPPLLLKSHVAGQRRRKRVVVVEVVTISYDTSKPHWLHERDVQLNNLA
jgi:hypothetical protein